jgi:hypothetical protein
VLSAVWTELIVSRFHLPIIDLISIATGIGSHPVGPFEFGSIPSGSMAIPYLNYTAPYKTLSTSPLQRPSIPRIIGLRHT